LMRLGAFANVAEERGFLKLLPCANGGSFADRTGLAKLQEGVPTDRSITPIRR